MARRNSHDLAADLKEFGLEGKVVGIHSDLGKLGRTELSKDVTATEEAKGLSPIAKTVIESLKEAVGPEGTIFSPTHSNNNIGGYQPDQIKVELERDDEGKVIKRTLIDDGIYNSATSFSNVGALTNALCLADGAIRSEHPSHSVVAIGKEAEYLVAGHTPSSQAVGMENAFTKVIGLDGGILFIGETLKSNTSFHSYETLTLQGVGDYVVGTAIAWENGLMKCFPQKWAPIFHRDFYEDAKRKTRGIEKIKESGLLKTGKMGNSIAFYFDAKPMARYFVNEVFTTEPDILLCAAEADCCASNDCMKLNDIFQKLYGNGSGGWDKDKIIADTSKDFLALLEDGQHRVAL